jgi:hypothetical protein
MTSTILLSATAKMPWGVRSCPRAETASKTANKIHARMAPMFLRNARM